MITLDNEFKFCAKAAEKIFGKNKNIKLCNYRCTYNRCEIVTRITLYVTLEDKRVRLDFYKSYNCRFDKQQFDEMFNYYYDDFAPEDKYIVLCTDTEFLVFESIEDDQCLRYIQTIKNPQ